MNRIRNISRAGFVGSSIYVFAIIFSHLVLGTAVAESASALTRTEHVSNYRFGKGDKVRIQVFNEPEMDVETVITNEGTVAYPLLGEMNIAGMTAREIAQYITDRLRGPFFVDPKVIVSLIAYRDIFVHGQVKNPGGFPYQPGLTVEKAIALAGGFTERASRSAITVIREDDPTHTPKEIGLDAVVSPGDILSVEESFF